MTSKRNIEFISDDSDQKEWCTNCRMQPKNMIAHNTLLPQNMSQWRVAETQVNFRNFQYTIFF